MSTVLDVRDENYKEFTDSAGAVVAYGLATCEPCNTYDPILEATAAQFPSIKVGKAKMHVPGRCREIRKPIRSRHIQPPTSFPTASCS
jgi:thioredoxin reductase (NADPH)